MVDGTRDEDVTQAVAAIRLVPDRYRVFREPVGVVRSRYRIDPATLTRALSLGLPSTGTGADLRFDQLDLRNLVISLRLNAPWFVAMRWWASALLQRADEAPCAYQVAVVGQCEQCPNCVVDVAPEVLAAASDVGRAMRGDAHVALTVRLAGKPVGFPADVVDVLRLAAPVRWHLVPNALAEDVAFLKDTGLADCRLMARYLWQEARDRGMAVRRAYGLVLTVPFSMTHDWVEFNVDDQWLPADPLLLTSMARWGYLDPHEWPPTTSPWGTLWRVAERTVPLVRHNGTPARWTLPTSPVV